MTQNLEFVFQNHPYSVLFATVVGSTAFGYATSNSDYDIHGVHLASAYDVLSLNAIQETFEVVLQQTQDQRKIEMKTYDLKKFILLLLKSNGGVLENLYSTTIILSSAIHQELKEYAKECITQQCTAYYKGVVYNQLKQIDKIEIKKLLVAYRCLLTGIHLMISGEVLINLPMLAEDYHQPQILELIQNKISATALSTNSITEHLGYIEQLKELLDQATLDSHLPKGLASVDKLNSLLIRARLSAIQNS